MTGRQAWLSHRLKIISLRCKLLVPAPRFCNEFFEEQAGKLVFLVGSFRMPLHTEDPLLWIGAFNRLDDPVLRRGSGKSQSVPNVGKRLMMGGVYPHLRFAGLSLPCKLLQQRPWLDFDLVSPGLVQHLVLFSIFNMLDKLT